MEVYDFDTSVDLMRGNQGASTPAHTPASPANLPMSPVGHRANSAVHAPLLLMDMSNQSQENRTPQRTG